MHGAKCRMRVSNIDLLCSYNNLLTPCYNSIKLCWQGVVLLLRALTMGWAVIYADRTCMYPLLSVMAASMSLSSTQVGGLTSAYFFLYVLMQIPAGIIGDRLGLKTVLIVMYGVAGLGLLGLGLWGVNYSLLLLFAALHGLGAGAYYPAAYGTTLQVVPPERRGYSSAIIGMGMALGLLAGLAVSGPVYEALGDFHAPFVLMSIPTFLMLPYFSKSLPNIKGDRTPTWQDYKAILRDKQLWLINAATFTALYGFWVAITWGPTYLKVEKGFSLGQAGFYTGLMAVTAVPAALLWGKLSDRLGRKPVALAVLPAAALSLYLLAHVDSKPGIIATLLLLGLFTNSAFTPITVAWTGDIVSTRYPGRMGAAVGIFNSTIMCAAIVAPIVSGYLRDATGSLAAAIIAGSAVMLVGTLLLCRLTECKTPARNSPPGNMTNQQD